MNPNQNRINPTGAQPRNAFEDENKAAIKADLLKMNPKYKNDRQLAAMVDAIWKGSNWTMDAQTRPSDALRSDGQLHGTDADAPPASALAAGDEFYSDMEGYRKKEMADKTALPETSDPEDDRFFAEEKVSPGEAWLRKMQRNDVATEKEGQTPEGEEPGLEAGQVRPAGAQSLEVKAGSPAGQKSFSQGGFKQKGFRQSRFYGR